jgi:hypothetical protein
MRTLDVLCQVRPEFLVPWVSVLQPHLKGFDGPNVDETKLIEHLASVIRQAVPIMKSPHKFFLDNIVNDLVKIIREGTKIAMLASAIPCLSVVAETATHNPKPVLELVKIFYSFLRKHREAEDVPAGAPRCLYGLAQLLKHFDVDGHCMKESLNLLNLEGEVTASSCVEAAHAMFVVYFNKSSKGLAAKKYALQGLVNLFTRHPPLMLKAQDIIKACFEQGPDMQVETLRHLRSFIELEDQSQERQSEDFKRRQSMLLTGEEQEEEEEDAPEKSKGSWLERDDEALDYLPGMIQVYEKSVLRLTLSPNKTVRLNAVAFVAAYLKQGVTNPIDAIPYVIALLTDRQEESKRLAVSIMARLYEKKNFRHFIIQHFMDGLTRAFELQSVLYKDVFDPLGRRGCDAVPMDGLLSLFSLLAQTNSANHVYDSVLAEMIEHVKMLCKSCGVVDTEGETSLIAVDKRLRTVELLGFLASVFAHIPFDDDQPIRVIEKINRFVNNQGHSLEAALWESYKAVGAGPGTEEQQRRLEAHCEAAMCMSVVLLTKLHLQNAYGVTSAKVDDWRSKKVLASSTREH